MGIDKALLTGSTTMLVLKLLDGNDMYGYQMIEELARRSEDAFTMKAGTLYPLLHGLESDGFVSTYDDATAGPRPRRYYHITDRGKRLLAQKQAEWAAYTGAVNRVMGGASHAIA